MHIQLSKSLIDKDSKQIDDLFSVSHDRVFKSYNCLACANCCRNYSPIIEVDEIAMLMKAIDVSSTELFDKYVEMDEDGDFVFKSKPCPMLDLEDNRYTIYTNRPKACREYPHTNMKNIQKHLDILEKNIEICPAAAEIVHNVLNELQHV